MQDRTYQRSPEYREIMRQAMQKAMRCPEVREKCRQAALKGWADPVYRERIRKAMTGKHHTAETREKVRKARLGRVFPKKMTSLERLLHHEFKKRRLKFEMHRTMFGRWQPDFVFDQARLVVEADGDYWHSLPGRQASAEALRDMAVAEGWSVWRFGEKEIKMHSASCGRAVARFVRDHKED